ncbi:hypothetical protein M885DRAFT_541742 [Pelagophyceae sp. CCMP2097]|nr:hypothetical protein M885DRAFT_541742 [Pelagophyceae sp. CCMP2097]
MPAEPGPGETPSAAILEGAYNQTYLIRTSDDVREHGGNGKEAESDDEAEYQERRVLFRCGNWCYTGHVTLESAKISLPELPRVIPALQRQQNRLHFYCNASTVPHESSFKAPMEYLAAAAEFAAGELSADHVHRELEKWGQVYSWMESEPQHIYFELQAAPAECMEGIALAATKTYARGLVIITVYHEGALYVVIQDGEGDQPLLDVKFPDVSQPGQGAHLASYAQPDDGKKRLFEATKLTLWHSLTDAADTVVRAAPAAAVKTADLSTDSYVQMYTILKATDDGSAGADNAHHDVLFRFGSWCYSGSVQLTPLIDLADLPHLIPALRVQQSRLDFICDASRMPTHSPFAKPMKYLAEITPVLERELINAEAVLRKLLGKFSAMEVGNSLQSWLDGDAHGSFFEFQLVFDKEMEKAFKNVDLVASKCYTPSGVVVVAIFYQSTLYVVLSETAGEQPLLDSRFPDVSSKGRGYLVASYAQGVPEWPQLRKVSIWQTAAAMKAEIDAATAAQGAKGAEAPATPAAPKPSPSAAAPAKDDDDAVARPRASASPTARAARSPTAKATPEDDVESRSPFSLQAQAIHDPAFQAKREQDRKESGDAPPDRTSELLQAQPKKKNPLLAALQPMNRAKVAAPHHVPPVQGLGANLAKVRAQLGAAGEAPWDEFGRPKVQGFKK